MQLSGQVYSAPTLLCLLPNREEARCAWNCFRCITEISLPQSGINRDFVVRSQLLYGVSHLIS